MTFTLTINDSTALRVVCAGSWDLPGQVDYEGDTGLLETAPQRATGMWMSYWLHRAASRSGAKLGGDWTGAMNKAHGALKL